MNLFMFFGSFFKVWLLGLIIVGLSGFALAEQQFNAAYLTTTAAKYKNTSSSKAYEGNTTSPIQLKTVSYTFTDDNNSFFEGGLSFHQIKNDLTTIKQQQYYVMVGQTVSLPNTYVFGMLDLWSSKHSGGSSDLSLSRNSIGVGLRQRFGDFVDQLSGSFDLMVDYPISSSAKQNGITWKPKPGIGYKLSIPIEWFSENNSWWILAEPYYRQFKMKASDSVSGTHYSESQHTLIGINLGVGSDF